MWNNDLFKPEGGNISGNKTGLGVGVYVSKGGAFPRGEGTISGDTPEDIKQEE